MEDGRSRGPEPDRALARYCRQRRLQSATGASGALPRLLLPNSFQTGTRGERGARGYMVDGMLIRGFAFAYPAAYRNSGVMTFIVNQDRVVYEKDLGPQTAELAAAMQEYNPDTTWEQAN
jgi:hypothetical protein